MKEGSTDCSGGKEWRMVEVRDTALDLGLWHTRGLHASDVKVDQ